MANQSFDDKGNQSSGSGSQNNTVQQVSASDPAGTSIQGTGNTDTATKGSPKPNKRWKNPLGEFASYTYQISLYMVTPSAYDLFNTTGRKNLEGLVNENPSAAVALICQSGGSNNVSYQAGKPNSGLDKAMGFGLDYFIDNLQITAAISGQETLTAANQLDLSFNIIEPLGFSFLSNLRRSMDELKKLDKNKGYPELRNALRQFFVLGIRFKGYDKFGNVVTNLNQIGGLETQKQESSEAVFERFYDIIIKEFKFKLDGRATVYNISSAVTSHFVAYGAKRGIVDKPAAVKGVNVEQALNGLMNSLNKEQQTCKDNKKIDETNNYSIKFIGDGIEQLTFAALATPADTDKKRLEMANVKSTADVTPEAESKSAPDTTSKQIIINGSTPILQAIDEIIKQSDFIQKALTTIRKANEEPTPTDPEEQYEVNKTPNTFYWYNVSCKISNARWDGKISDFAYDITYVIQLYQTPVLIAAGIKALPKYYGPHKRYEYYFTGKNSEIISYEQTHNNGYYNIILIPDGSGIENGGDAQIPTESQKRAPGSRVGEQGQGLEMQNQAIASLYDPSAYVSSRIQILGDPDYLMPMYPDGLSGVYNRFYQSDGYTINPNGGQVFIEVNFYEAVDYDTHNSGLMLINNKVIYWKYPKSIQQDIDSRGGGVIFRVTKVKSVFSQGRFTQELTLIAGTFGDSDFDKLTVAQGRQAESNQNSPKTNQREAKVDTNVTGLTPEPKIKPSLTVSDSQEDPTPNSSMTNNDQNVFES